MRTTREIRAELDAVNEGIEATRALMEDRAPLPCYTRADKAVRSAYQADIDALDRKRRRLEAELAESRAADELTPPLFGGQS
jgi:hypothetical protein